MGALQQLEHSLNEIFVKHAPDLPKGGKDFLVTILPWLTLIGGVLSALSVWWLYDWAHTVNRVADYVNELSRTYGVDTTIGTSRWSVGIWLALIVLVITALLYLMAFSPLRNKQKAGWNLLFYTLILNVIYGFVVMFTDYGNVGSFIGSLVGFTIGGYLLFQVRNRYSLRPRENKKSAASSAK